MSDTQARPFERPTDELRQVLVEIDEGVTYSQPVPGGSVVWSSGGTIKTYKVQRKWVVQDGPELKGYAPMTEWHEGRGNLMRRGGYFSKATFVRLKDEWRDLPTVKEGEL